MGDEIVLSFEDSLLRKSDVVLLEGNGWLNDRLIGFWFEYMYHEVCDCDPSIALVGPEVTQFIKVASKDEGKLFTEPLELPKKRLILLPINDSLAADCPGGTHWSLLVYEAQKKTFYHLDSLDNANHVHAMKVAQKLELTDTQLVVLDSSQQENFSDCGIFVCYNAELALKHIRSSGISGLSKIFTTSNIDAKRHRERMKSVIKTLSKNH